MSRMRDPSLFERNSRIIYRVVMDGQHVRTVAKEFGLSASTVHGVISDAGWEAKGTRIVWVNRITGERVA